MLLVGNILREARQKKNLSLEEVGKEIKIRPKFLKAVENNDWSFCSKVYVTGIVKNYANFLNLDEQKVLAFFRRDYEKKEKVSFKKKVNSKYLVPDTKKALSFFFILTFFLFFIYFSYQVKLYLTPPKVVLLSPKSEKVVNKTMIKIIGKTDKNSSITILGNRVYGNEEGIFEYNFPLEKGRNVLKIEVVGANGKKTEFNKTFTLE